MELPELGKRCMANGCNLYDFLPYNCVNCKKIFCQDHFKLDTHNCPSLKDPSRDVRVPICPMCENPVPVERGADPNIRMNQHIQNNCKDLKPKNSNTCRKKGCTEVMLVPMRCGDCGSNFCIKHRLGVDHECNRKPSAASGKKSNNNKNTSQKQQNPSRGEMEKQRLTRIEEKNQEIIRLQSKLNQGTITDAEQVHLAKLLSTNDSKSKKCYIS